MTTKILSTYAAFGYTLSPGYDGLDITATGTVVGYGVSSDHFAILRNGGTVRATATKGQGVELTAGGVVVNQEGAYIGGYNGVISFAPVAVYNYGTIRAVSDAVHGGSGGSVVNGSYTSGGATIAGGAIVLTGASGTVSNLGTITAYLDLGAGGTVTNGGVRDTTALINGADGISIAGGAGTVKNFGTIETPGFGQIGVYLRGGGQVTNGAADDTAARIEGYYGVRLSSGTVTNFGVIDGAGEGALLFAGGRVTNGDATDSTALIEGYTGVRIAGAAGTVTNFGTIRGTGASGAEEGLDLRAGGVVVNGSRKNGGALIEGYTGLSLDGKNATATNFGTISGVGGYGGYGAFLGGGADLTNGAAGRGKAVIKGFEGVALYGRGGTVTNFGTIIGTGGTAVRLGSSSDLLVVEAGSAFVGAVIGGGGTLELDGGIGKLSGLFDAEGGVTVSGSMAATTFGDFATLRIGQAATFTASGDVSLTAREAIRNSGSLTLGGGKASVTSAGLIEADRGVLAITGAVENTGILAAAGGTLAVAGDVTGSGSATIAGGVLDFEAAFAEDVTFTGKTGILELGQSRSYAGTITGFSKAGGTSLDLDDIAFGKATKATYAGNRQGGVLTVTDGNHTAHITLEGDYRHSAFVAASDGHGGTLVHDPAAFVAAMAGFGAAGAGPVEARALWAHTPPMLLAPRTQIA